MESTRFAWLETYLLMLGVGAILAISLHLIIRPRLLRIVGAWPFCTPNWQSIWGVVITLPGLLLFFTADGNKGRLWGGLIISVIGRMLDRFDGRTVKSLFTRFRFLLEIRLTSSDSRQIISSPDASSAPVAKNGVLWAWFEVEEETDRREKIKVQRLVYIEDWLYYLTRPGTRLPMFCLERSTDPHYPGLRLFLTGLGACLDPLGDKLCFLPPLIYLAVQDWVYPWLAVLMVLSELFSTVMRAPFDRMPGFRVLQRWVREEKASALGKTKFAWQTLTLAAVMPVAAGWLQTVDLPWSRRIASALLGLGVITGILSNLSRMAFWQDLIKAAGLVNFNRKLGRLYEHDLE